MTLLQSVREYLSGCPALKERRGRIEFYEDGEAWTLYDGGEMVESCYWDGGQVRCHRFSLMLRQYADTEELRLENCGTMQTIMDWLARQERTGCLPVLPPGKTAEKLECRNGALTRMDPDSVSGNYQIQLLLYYEERGDILA